MSAKVSLRVFLTIDVTENSFEVLHLGMIDKLDNMAPVSDTQLSKEQAEAFNAVFENLVELGVGS